MTDEVVISTKDRPGTFDAIETAKPGEPLFALQGGDPFAPATVLHWAGLARRAGMDAEGEAGEKLLVKATAAESVAWAMQAYQRGEQTEAARQPAQDEPEQVLSDLGGDLARGADKLHNSLAEAVLIAEMLESTNQHPEAAAKIRAAAEVLKDAAYDIEPRRHLQRERTDG